MALHVAHHRQQGQQQQQQQQQQQMSPHQQQQQSVSLNPYSRPPSPASLAPQSHSSHIIRPSQPVKIAGRKRKKQESPEEKPEDISYALGSSQPPARRLRRLHEACARCRSKKIKCDSKLPSCSACAAANVECNQEDRHRQTLKPRGHTDMVEGQLSKCIQVLQKFIPDFKVEDVDMIMAQHGIVFIKPEETSLPPPPPLIRADSAAPVHSNAYESPSDGSSTTLNGYDRAQSVSYSDPRPSPQSGIAPPTVDVKGQDPQSNDLSSTGGLIKAFGVAKSIVRDLPKPDSGSESEDVLGGVRMYNDPVVSTYPKRASQWTARALNRRGFTVVPSQPAAHPGQSAYVLAAGPRQLAFHLPKDRSMTEYICNSYFTRLNWHRPVYEQNDFMLGLGALYDSLDDEIKPTVPMATTSPTGIAHPTDDPGFLCSVYLILALGTLSEENNRLHHTEGMPDTGAAGYPTHEEFFELALAVKPDLRVTISSLQAMILLQWYLYTERHGRTLWRLVGNLVRLSVELGLHHDPSEQGSTFTPAECELRTRLWWIVMIHDRGTSVLLGRPLAIADADFNTPFPKRFSASMFSEHFDHSPHLTGIQGDIINALYRPGNHKQSADQVVRHASRITKNLVGFRSVLPDTYRPFFEGTASWSEQERIALVTNITEDQGLTMLKYGIARILLLRALFTSGQLSGDVRRRALKDAVITSHNILITQCQVTSFPSIAFFVSPIPIHIAAMVILYGVISKCDALPYAKAKEDVCIALQLVPLFRWRWHRKDSHGSHPLIVKLAQKVFGMDVLNVSGPTGPPMLLPEWDWTEGDAQNMMMQPPMQHMSGGPGVSGGSPTSTMPPTRSGSLASGATNGNSMYGIDQPMSQNGQGYGHSRHSSGLAGVGSASSSSAPLPLVVGTSSTSPQLVNAMSANIPSSSSRNGLPSPHPAINGFSPTSHQQQNIDTPGSGGYQPVPIDDMERDAIVRFMYPPPLPNSPTNFFDGHHHHSQHIPPPPPPHHMGPSTSHGHNVHQPPHVPPQHPHPHNVHPEEINQLFGTLQPVYGDYNQSENYYVQEEYDGGGTVIGGHGGGDPMLKSFQNW